MNIHILSNSPTRVNSGFGIVTRNLALELSKIGHNVSVSDMQNIYNREYWNDIVIYPMNSVQSATTGSGFYINELRQLRENLKESKADVMIIVYPTYNNVIVSNKLHELFSKTVWYYPVEGKNLPDVHTNELMKVETVVPMTKFGKHELMNKEDINITKEIYHGYDPDIFKKINIDNKDDNENLHYCIWKQRKYMYMQDSRWLCENGCFNCSGCDDNCKFYTEEKIVVNLLDEEFVGKVSNIGTLKDQFGVETIFTFVGENSGTRKKIDRLLNAYSKLKKMDKNNEIMLLLHTLPNSNIGLNLWEYVMKYKLNRHDSNVVFTYGMDNLGNSWSDAALNVMYNVGDVNVSASSAEGFGLPTIESMACGKCNIGPDFSSFTELIGNDEDINNNRGLLSTIQGYQKISYDMIRALVFPKSLAENMLMLHEDKNLANKLGNNAYEWVQQHTWKNKALEFDNLLNSDKFV